MRQEPLTDVQEKRGTAPDLKLEDLVTSIFMVARGYSPGNKTTVINETPSDMDGIVLKVTIT